MRALILTILLLLAACTGVPAGIEPVRGFDSQRYLGTWYEIARLDHGFERGLQAVTAHYSQRPDGGINVINRGFDTDTNRWREAEGKAYFVGQPDIGHLKVSFFGPFYGSYIVFKLDENYQYALVTSTTKDYAWILARTPKLPTPLQQQLVKHMADLGFAVDQLIFVDQEL